MTALASSPGSLVFEDFLSFSVQLIRRAIQQFRLASITPRARFRFQELTQYVFNEG
jgi:hypothetical protein